MLNQLELLGVVIDLVADLELLLDLDLDRGCCPLLDGYLPLRDADHLVPSRVAGIAEGCQTQD